MNGTARNELPSKHKLKVLKGLSELYVLLTGYMLSTISVHSIVCSFKRARVEEICWPSEGHQLLLCFSVISMVASFLWVYIMMLYVSGIELYIGRQCELCRS